MVQTCIWTKLLIAQTCTKPQWPDSPHSNLAFLIREVWIYSPYCGTVLTRASISQGNVPCVHEGQDWGWWRSLVSLLQLTWLMWVLHTPFGDGLWFRLGTKSTLYRTHSVVFRLAALYGTVTLLGVQISGFPSKAGLGGIFICYHPLSFPCYHFLTSTSHCATYCTIASCKNVILSWNFVQLNPWFIGIFQGFYHR